MATPKDHPDGYVTQVNITFITKRKEQAEHIAKLYSDMASLTECSSSYVHFSVSENTEKRV